MIVIQQTHIELDTVETLVFRELLTLLLNTPDSPLQNQHVRLMMELLAKLPQ